MYPDKFVLICYLVSVAADLPSCMSVFSLWNDICWGVQVRIIKLFGVLVHLFKKDLAKVPRVSIDGHMSLAVVLQVFRAMKGKPLMTTRRVS